MRKLEFFISLILFLTLTIIASFNLIISHGTIIHHDWSIPPYREQIIQDFPSEFFSAWQNGKDVTIYSRGGWILGLINRLLSLVFSIDGEYLTKAYLFFTIWLSGFNMYYVSRLLRRSWFSSFLAGLFYMFSPWLFERVVAGVLPTMLAYSFYPLYFYLFTKSIHDDSVFYSLLVSMLLLIIDNITFILIFCSFILYLAVHTMLSKKRKKELFMGTKSLSIIFCIFLVSNLYWLIPSILSPPKITPTELATINDLIVRSRNAQLINVIRGIDTVMGFFLSIVYKIGMFYPAWFVASFSAPLIAFSITIFHKNENVFFFSLLAIISIFLGKGINPPLGQVYLWLYNNVPYFIAFRDPNKFIMITSFTYAFLLLESIEFITKKMFRFKSISLTSIKRLHKLSIKKCILYFTILIFFTTVLFASYPFLAGNLSAKLRAVNFPDSYQTVTRWLAEQSGDFRVLWLPPDPYTQYDWIGTSYQQRDLIASYSPKQNLMSYSPSSFGIFSYFVASALYHNETRYLAKILAIANVKYILFRNDAEGWWWRNWGWTRKKLSYIIQHQERLKLIRKIGSIEIYENEYYENYRKIFVTNNTALISGGLSSLISLTYLNDVPNVVLFAEQIPENDIQLYSKYVNKLFIKDGDFLSFVFSFIPQEYKINPSNYAIEGDKTKGWATLYSSNYWWRHPYYLDSIEETAITSTNASLNMTFLSQHPGIYEVWIKLFWHPDLSLTVMIDDTKIGEICSKDFSSLGYSWIRVNSTYLVQGSHLISIRNTRVLKNPGALPEILVSKVAIVPENVMKNAFKNAIDIVSNKDIYLIFEAEKTRIDFSMKSWVLDGSFGLNASQGLAMTSKTYGFITYHIFIPKSDHYDIFLRSIIHNTSRIDILIDDNNTYSLFPNTTTDFSWLNATRVYMKLGWHTIRIASEGRISIDLLMLKSRNHQTNVSLIVNNIPYTKISPTRYTIYPESHGSFFIFFGEPYSDEWKVLVNGRKIVSIPAYFGFNGFFVSNLTKIGPVTIEFEKQIYFEVGLYAYLITFLAILTFCVYSILKKLKSVNIKTLK